MIFKQKLLEKAYFIVNDWSCHGLADQFWLLKTALSFILYCENRCKWKYIIYASETLMLLKLWPQQGALYSSCDYMNLAW